MASIINCYCFKIYVQYPEIRIYKNTAFNILPVKSKISIYSIFDNIMIQTLEMKDLPNSLV